MYQWSFLADHCPTVRIMAGNLFNLERTMAIHDVTGTIDLLV
jgi:hypothetical protein